MFEEYFHEFCKTHGYHGEFGYDKELREYHIVISKGNDNAGAFMSKDEIIGMSNSDIRNLLKLLHLGFVRKFENDRR